ncbi:MAG TPA: hypothetical protein PKE69_04005 [Pyrinomonadaceae bacterium]|nr:hypothetical protein [Pyrinomonadaceae bacterium]
MLIENGWNITELEGGELDWWASEMWLIESVWSPIGATAYITFLFDPMDAKEVWDVAASSKKLENRRDTASNFYLNIKSSGWKKELPEFIKSVSELRNL